MSDEQAAAPPYARRASIQWTSEGYDDPEIALEGLGRHQATQAPPYEELESPVVAITGYRVLVSALLVTLGVVKATLQYQGKQIAPNTLDLVLCLTGTFT